MLLIVGTIRLPRANVEKAKAVMQRMILASRAEDGSLAYHYAEDMLDAGLIHVHELWHDRAALDRHFASAHIAAWRETWPALAITDRNLLPYEVSDPEPV